MAEKSDQKGVSFQGVTPGTYTAIVRNGEAEPIYPPRVINIEAQITEPLKFYQTRKKLVRLDRSGDFFLPNTTSVLVVREHGKMTLVWDETSQHANRITGTLETSEYYRTLGINNSSKQLSPNDLADLLKRHRFLFKSQELGMEVISKLKNLKATISTELESQKDERANKKSLVEHRVSSNIPEFFEIVISPYKGFEKKAFQISIILENVGQNVTCWLESIGALETMEEQREKIFDEQLKEFNDDGIAVIEC